MNKIPKHISYNLAGTLTQLNQFEHYNKLIEKMIASSNPDEFNKEGIDKAKTFFKENIHISINKLDDWNKLKDYQSVRNFFVHNPYEAIRADHKSFAAFQRLNSINLTKYDLDDNTSSYSIEITSQLCLDLLDLAHSFFNNFYRLLENPK
ncbi:hypothetical protein ASE51_09585 [Bacillus sp. Root147]|nr:hypothetical protein ASE51_09585 [Bacillus sp. Root147]